jgi:hypothetical protein
VSEAVEMLKQLDAGLTLRMEIDEDTANRINRLARKPEINPADWKTF